MHKIGERLRALRKNKNMTLKHVSEGTGLSESFLSQVEHSKSSITIESLMKISETFNVNPSFFFSDLEEKEKEKKIRINKNNSFNEEQIISNFKYKDLSGKFSQQTFLPTLVTLHPRRKGVRPLPHRGQEFIYVLSGILTVIFDYDEISLEEGESIHMESTIPHNWVNKTESEVKFLYVSSR